MKTQTTSVEEYLSALSPERREIIDAIRGVILKNLDAQYEEGLQYGMLGYFVPLELFPAGYNNNPKQPLMIAALASQKSYVSLYLGVSYCGCGEDTGGENTPDMQWFRDAWKKTGKKLDMGKACVRIKKLDDVALDVVGEAIRRVPAQSLICYYESSNRKNKQPARKK